MWMGLLEPLQPHLGEQLRRLCASLGAWPVGDAQRERGVIDSAQPRQQQVALGHQCRGCALDRADVGGLQAADQLQQGGLAAAARADHREQFAVVGVQ